MIKTPAEDLAADLWPHASPEQIKQLAAALSRSFQKLKPAPELGLRTFCTKSQKKLEKGLSAPTMS